MLVLAVIHRMNQLVGQRIQHFDWVRVHWRDIDFVHQVFGSGRGSALANGTAPFGSRWNRAGDPDSRNRIARFIKNGCNVADRKKQPGLACKGD